MKNILLGAALISLWAPLVSAQQAQATVAATLPPLAAMVQMLLPHNQPPTPIDCLLTGSADPHHLQLSPGKAETLRAVHLLIRSSGDDGGWSGLRSFHGAVVDLWPQAHHPWLIPHDLLTVLPPLADRLVQHNIIPATSSQQRLADLTTRLQQLDRAWANMLQPLRQRGVIMQHPAWQRLFAHYKVPVRAVLESSHHGGSATPRHLEAALKLLRGDQPPLLVKERSHSNRMIDWLQQRTPTSQVVELDALGRCDQPLDQLIAKNLQQLRQILAP